ncbi:MAG: hypothetical protein AAFP19_22655, partial [Bacteroidota bacterium]
ITPYMYYRNLPIFLLLVLLYACQANESNNQHQSAEEENSGHVIAITKDPRIDRAKLYEEVMNIHDEVMPKMSDINRIKRQLRGMTEAEPPLKEEQIKKAKEQIKALDDASEAMMSWMREFKQPAPEVPQKEAMALLVEEKGKISKVSEMMLQSIKDGQELITELKKDK